MQITIVSYLLYRLTNDVLSLGMLGLWEAIPAIGCSFFSGHFVDNREKKSMLTVTAFGYLCLAILFAGIATTTFQERAGITASVYCIYFGIFCGGVLRAFFSPSSFSMLGLLVPRRLYPNATTWSSTSWQTGAVVGPLLGGLLMAYIGVVPSLAIVVALVLTSLILILRIPKQRILRKHFEPALASIATGMRFLFKNKIILSVLSLDMFAVLFGGAVALLPVYAKDILHVGAVGYGWLRAAAGIGAVVTLFGLSFLPLKTNPGKKLLLCIVGFGITIIVFGISKWFWLSFIMLLIGGMFDAISVVIRGTILQVYTPDDMRGRISAISTMFISSSNELGAAESGVAAKLMGTVTSVVFGGCMTLVVTAITYFKVPTLRKMSLDGKHEKIDLPTKDAS